jgi:hypothetical protein
MASRKRAARRALKRRVTFQAYPEFDMSFELPRTALQPMHQRMGAETTRTSIGSGREVG